MPYALGTLQERGQLFVEPGTECYEGMIVGERSKAGDMVVNIARTKNLGNQRSSTSDISVQLVPPRTFSLEEALEYIADDRAGRDYSQEHSPAQASAQRHRPQEGCRPRRSGQQISTGFYSV